MPTENEDNFKGVMREIKMVNSKDKFKRDKFRRYFKHDQEKVQNTKTLMT